MKNIPEKCYIDMGLKCYYIVWFHSTQKINEKYLFGKYDIYVKDQKLCVLPFNKITTYIPTLTNDKSNVYNKKQSFMKIKCNI